jgi:hypothetical protein
MSAEQIERLVWFLMLHPDAGDEMPGTGGCRKLRWAEEGRGKRGSYRIITFYSGESIPLFLLTAYRKNEKANITPREQITLKTLTIALRREYQK